jgi:uncharacterized protein (TIGR02594 family)
VPDGIFGPLTEAAVRMYQASSGISSNGVADSATWAALHRGLHRAPPHLVSVSSRQYNPTWLIVAKQEIGQAALRGARSNPRILLYHSSCRCATDDTAWCSSFVNWCLRQVGIKGTGSAAAISWVTWGESCGVRVGAIAILYNPRAAGTRSSTSGYHVGFVMQTTDSCYSLLGGNQSHQVKVSDYSKSKWHLVALRWPKP